MSEKIRSYFLLAIIIFLVAVPIVWITRFVCRLYSHSSFINTPDNTFLRLKHLGLIMDGNRRWARSHNYSNEMGYKEGGDRLWEIMQLCIEEGVDSLTVYALSIDNVKKRNQDEFDLICDIGFKMLEAHQQWLINQGVRVYIIGERALFSEKMLKRLQDIENETREGNILKMYVLLGYDPVQDMLQSTRAILKQIKNNELKEEDINETIFFKTIQSSLIPPIDLIIRTGGRERLSGFLPMQSIYSEFVFLPYMWPDINKDDVKKIIRNFFMRTRNFGK